jgi:vitamin B12 transporter
MRFAIAFTTAWPSQSGRQTASRLAMRALPLLLLSTSAVALAQEQAENDAIIVTASRATENPHDIGSAVSVITDAKLQRDQITFVKDALLDVPGVAVSSDRPGDFTNVSIRGSNNDEVLWLIDGIELGDPSSISTQFQADHLITADVSRIEVLRGNQSSLYGSDAIGGVVNIITKRATQQGIAVNSELEVGSHGTVNAGTSVLGKSGPVDFRVTATGYRHEGPSLADPATATSPVTEDDAYWRHGLSGRAGVAASDNLSFQVIGFWLDSFADGDDTTADSADAAKKREYAFAGQGEFHSDDGAFTARATASRYGTRRLYFGTWFRPEGDVYKGTKDQLALDLKYDTGGIVSVAAGGNLEWEDTDQLTNFSGAFVAGIHTRSVYGELAVRPIENLTLTGAARLDDNSRFGSFDTYRATAAYVIGPAKLRASYGTGAKAPGLYQLFDPSYGNPELKVEESDGWDVGVDLALGHSLTAQASYFVLDKTHVIGFDGSRPPFGGNEQWGRTTADGVEFGLAAQPLGWLQLSQTFTYINHRQDNDLDGVYVGSGRPRHIATSTVTVLPMDGVELTARVRYRDGDSSGYGGVTDDYVVADLLGSYRYSDGMELFARVVNLFDEKYQVTYGTNTLGTSVYVGARLGF